MVAASDPLICIKADSVDDDQISIDIMEANVMAQKLDRMAREADAVSTKIEGAYEKLISKLQSKSDKARARMNGERTSVMRNMLGQRAKLYAEAAQEIGACLTKRRIASADVPHVNGKKASSRDVPVEVLG
ncbi:hypothetical protein ACRAWG_01050 [Methylobacterium sp. P31]